MDKQKQIDEMARTLTTCERNSCVGCGRECIDYRMAKSLYNAGYRKIPENAVVLTKEELANMRCENIEVISQAQAHTRIEIAEKFAELKTVWKQRAKEYTDWAGNKVQAVTLDWLFADIDETCKEFTEGEYGESLCEE